MICELKKCWGYQSIRFLVLFIFLCPIIVSLIFIHGAESYEFNNGEIKYRMGIEALRDKGNRTENNIDYLDEAKVHQPLKYLIENWEKENAYEKMEAKYPEYYHILYEAYESPLHGKEYNIKNAEADNFYEEVNARRKERMEIEQARELNIDDLIWLNKLEEQIQGPFIIGNTNSWIVLIKSLYLSFAGLLFLLILVGNFIFSIDRELNMEEILYVKGCKSLLLKKKKLNTYLLTSLLSLIYASLTCILMVRILGGRLPNISIQIIPQLLISPYNMTGWTMLALYLILAFIGIGVILILNSVISDGFKNPIISALISISILFFCFYLKNKTYASIGLRQLILLLPSSSIDILRILSIVSFVNFFRIKVSLFTLAIAINVGLLLLGYILYFIFNRLRRYN
ncbi:hypothetical protein AAA081_03495 [Aedoeadaptatus acetigenes]|uniref:ABC-2 family transporter protein n=1 Tax=Aedoeadaptatus acetigenes TaxID=2981723 RepID=A0ABV1J7D4_9FIRM